MAPLPLRVIEFVPSVSKVNGVAPVNFKIPVAAPVVKEIVAVLVPDG